MRAVAACICLALGVADLGCGDQTIPSSTPPSFAADPDQILASDSGALSIAVRFAPRPPVVGTNAAQLSFTDAGGAPASSLSLTVVPWMPAHGHGASVDPTVTEMEPGVFVVTPLVLFMPGAWELRITTGGSVDDTAKAAFEIP